MAQVGGGGVVRLIQTLWDEGTVASLDDAELLGRFLGRGPTAEAAFAALVHRHAPMVLRVCRDITGDSHDAQDAAQVTFLVLARKTRSIRRGDALANWLFGTARRVAARAVRDAARRRRHERRYAETIMIRREAANSSDGNANQWADLYAELDRLPERYRVPIVLCDLESLTHDQAAAVIGCPIRTLQTRLYRGREQLRQRLLRRGRSPAVGLVGRPLLGEPGSAAVPTTWASSTAVAALGTVSGGAGATIVPEAVNRLLRGVNRAMFLSRLMRIAAVVAILGLSAGLTFALAPLAPRSQEVKPRREAKSAPQEGRPAPPGPMTTPITVRGRATDGAGQPVAGATIYLDSTRRTDVVIGTAITDRDGSYVFRNARLPIERQRDENQPWQGTFQVFGTAPGFGFAWHGMRSYLPSRRPDNRQISGEDYTLFGEDPKVMDLRFPPAASLVGQVVDERGRPIAGARIRLAACDYLDPQGKESHHNFREFWAIGAAPAALTTATTGRDGRFRQEGLPKEAGFWIHVRHPDYGYMALYAATTSRPTAAFDFPRQSIPRGETRPPVATGDLKITLLAPRRVSFRTVFTDSGRPAPKVKVTAGRGSTGTSASGFTDGTGSLLLRLPPGDYDLVADPAEDGAPVIRTISTFRVADQPAEQAVEVRVNPGCVVILEAVDARTGQGIPGVGFRRHPEGQPERTEGVQSRTGYVDYPRTDASGRLRAVVEPGEWVYSVGYIPESNGDRQRPPEERATLFPGRIATIRFELEK